MANALVNLASTTTLSPVAIGDTLIQLASTSGIVPNLSFLFVDKELMEVVSFGLGTSVNVIRGVQGSTGGAHASLAPVYIGRGDQFYSQDPAGLPPTELLVYPYINVVTGTLWAAQGDETGPGVAARQWQQITTAQVVGSFGSRSLVTTVPA